jgi:mannose/cellobiose epimerase-like protein (N-acyl-D-glucosamine 2-epimerase family)
MFALDTKYDGERDARNRKQGCDGSIHDAKARLWPQTERLKAALLAHEITDDAKFVDIAVEAAGTVIRYLETDIPGLWRDERSAEGSFSAGASPASSFHHLVGAIAELSRYKRARRPFALATVK